MASMMNAAAVASMSSMQTPTSITTTTSAMFSPMGGNLSSITNSSSKVNISDHQISKSTPSTTVTGAVSVTTTATTTTISTTATPVTTISTTSVPVTSAEIKETSTKTNSDISKTSQSHQQAESNSSTNTSASTTCNSNSDSPTHQICDQFQAASQMETVQTTIQASPPKSFAATSATQTPAASPVKNSNNKASSVESEKTTNAEMDSTPTVASPTNEGCTKTVNLSSANADSKTSASATVKTEKDLPKAMIKPNVLTHVIDGFIIQEASEPFPVNRQRYLDKDVKDEPPKKKAALEEALNGNLTNTALPSDMVACEQCGKSEHKSKLKKKRFCSVTCASQAKTSSNDSHPESGLPITNGTSPTMVEGSNKIESDGSNVANNNMGTDKMLVDSAGSASTQQTPSSNTNTQATANTSNIESGLVAETPQMANWTVSDVCEFIKNLPGCSDYVEGFEQQEIDGQALLLLKENHLVNVMGMELGLALQIVAKVESMKEINSPAVQSANTASDTQQ